MKTCFKCGQSKPETDFCKRKRSRDGLQPRCKECNKKSTALWVKQNAERMAELDAKYDERARERYKDDPEYRKMKVKRSRAWRKKAGPEHMKRVNRKYYLMRTFGLTEADVEAMIAKRNGRCDICGKMPGLSRDGKSKLHLDHCHYSHRVRGMLCVTCNAAIGKLGDTTEGLMRAVRYLRGEPDVHEPLPFIA